MKLVGISLLKEVTQEFIQPVFNYIVDMTIVKGIGKKIRDLVIETVKRWLRDINIIWRMLSIDVWTNTLRYKEIIINTVKMLLFDQAPISELQEFGVGVLKRLIKKNIILKVVNEVGSVVKDIVLVLPGLAKKLEEALIEKYLKELEQDEENKKNPNKDYERDMQATRTEKSVTIDKVEGEVADSITTKITSSITQNIVRPYSSQIVNSGIDTLYENYNENVENQLKNVKSKRKIVFVQNWDPTNRLPKEYKKVTVDQIEACKIDIKAVENGSMVGIHHMGSVSDSVQKSIIITDTKGKIMESFGSNYGKNGSLVIQYHEAVDGKSRGHFTLPDGTDPVQKYNNNTENDCLFNVIASLTGAKDPNKIRQDAVAAMYNNIEYQAMQHYDVQRLKQFKRESLLEGGVTKPNESFQKEVAVIEDAEKKAKDNNRSHLSGPCSIMTSLFKGGGQSIEINHVPPKSAYKDENGDFREKESDMLSVAMFKIDHRMCLSTKSPEYRLSIKTLLNLGDPRVEMIGDKKRAKFNSLKESLIPDLFDMHLVSLKNNTCDYIPSFRKTINDNVLEGRISKDDESEILEIIKKFPKRGQKNALEEFKNIGKEFLSSFDKQLNEKYTVDEIPFSFTTFFNIQIDTVTEERQQPPRYNLRNRGVGESVRKDSSHPMTLRPPNNVNYAEVPSDSE